MVWPWASPAVPAPPPAQTPSNPTEFPKSPPKPPQENTTDDELSSFLQAISAEATPSTTKYTRVSKTAASSSQTPEGVPRSDLPISEQILPTCMSCRDAFDAAFYCNSLGGQFNNVYRYGGMGECSEKWNDFWFCMKVRTWGEASKAEATRARYREKERVKYGSILKKEGEDDVEVGRSSEDIWKSRERMVQWGEAFNKPFPGKFEGSDAEWNELERERRRAKKAMLEGR